MIDDDAVIGNLEQQVLALWCGLLISALVLTGTRLLAEKRNGTISAAYKSESLHICAAFPQT